MTNCPKCKEPYTGSPIHCPLCHFKLREVSAKELAAKKEISMNNFKKESAEKNEVTSKAKYPLSINVISFIFLGISSYLSNEFISLESFSNYYYLIESPIKYSILRGFIIIAISWFAFSLPRWVYKATDSEEQTMDDKQN